MLIARPFGLLAVFALLIEPSLEYNILMATMGGTKSHTVPFVGLGTSLRSRGHNVTLLSAFTGPAANNGLHELVPPILEVIYDTCILRAIAFGKNCTIHRNRNGSRYECVDPFNFILS